MGRFPDAIEKIMKSRLVCLELVVGRSRRSHDAGVAKQKRSVGRTRTKCEEMLPCTALCHLWRDVL